MTKEIVKIHEGIIIDEEQEINLFQLCHYCSLEPEYVIDLVEEGILDPSGHSKQEWRFKFTSVARVNKALRLQRDFELNISGAALALHLLDRIDELESILKKMDQ